MASCRICLEDLRKPISLPCGHIFCNQCIAQTVHAVKPYTHIHPCPTCRTQYNIAPINLNVVPPNLRAFITPSVRKVYLDVVPAEGGTDIKSSPSSSSPTSSKRPLDASGCGPTTSPMSSNSEVARLRAENEALRGHCAMWRKRAEVHGAANLGLLKFARAVRDQASHLARERNELERRCYSLKRTLDGTDETPYGSAQNDVRDGPDPGSLLFAPLSPFAAPQLSPKQGHGGGVLKGVAVESTPSNESSRPRKRSRVEDPDHPGKLDTSDASLHSISLEQIDLLPHDIHVN